MQSAEDATPIPLTSAGTFTIANIAKAFDALTDRTPGSVVIGMQV